MQGPHLHARTPWNARNATRTGAVALLWTACLCWFAGQPAAGQGIEPDFRPIAEVRLTGLQDVPESLVRNAVRVEPGDVYDRERVNADVARITRLGRFSEVVALVEDAPDGSGVILTYALTEQPLLRSVQLRGVKSLEPTTLYTEMVLRAGDPADPFLIERARLRVIDAYEREGFFRVQVNLDEEALVDGRDLIFTVVEGPKVRVEGIRFEGNEVFPDEQLSEEVKQEVYFPIFKKGNLNKQQLTLDAANVRRFLRSRGYLEAEVDRRIDISPDQKSAVVTFVVSEGPRYTVRAVNFRSLDGQPLIFPDRQLLLAMALKPGSVYSEEQVATSADGIRSLYGKLGYLGTVQGRLGVPQLRVEVNRRFAPDEPVVTLDVGIEQGRPSTVGKVIVRGNDLTRTKIVLEDVRGMTPGRRFDSTGVERTARRLNESPLFRDTSVTVLGNPDDEVRDVLIEVAERNTGSISFGANISSDLGLGGAIDINQRNFDISDLPDSWGDLVSGQAFRGAGETFDLTLSPGNESSTYSVSWRDPTFADSDYSLALSGFVIDRDRNDFDEGRAGGQVTVGKRFGDVWSASVGARYTQIDIDDIEPDASVDVFAVQGESDLTSLSFNLRRSTVDSLFFPSRGSRLDFGIDQAGALGGDYDFTRLEASATKFWTVDEDFLGRKTVFSARIGTGYILQEDEAPVFERFFAGGRSFRGFEFRGVGPRGIRADTLTVGEEAVGGRFSLLTTLQYEFPLVDEYLRGVIFTDQGTIDEDFEVDDWRVTVGAGLRMQIPFLSQAPFAVDFAVPILEEEGDEEELVSFTLDIPFR